MTMTLKRFLSLQLNADRVVDDVAWEESYADVAHNVCSELLRSGFIDAKFFQHLRAHFSRLHPEIDALERIWGRSDPR